MGVSKKNGLLWAIGPTPSYLYGTMHLNTPVAFQSIERVKEKIQECQLYAAETSIEQLNTNPELLQLVTAKPGRRLSDRIRPKHYQRINNLLQKSLNLNLAAYDNLRPLLISNLIDAQLMPKGTYPHHLDEYLWNYATQLGIPTTGVETIEEQLDVFRNIDPEDELQILIKGLRNLPARRRNMNKIQEWYGDGDIDQLYQSTKKSLGKWRYILLKKRNQRMAERVLQLTQNQRVFIAIGAAHLAGKEGVLRLVKKQGLKIQSI